MARDNHNHSNSPSGYNLERYFPNYTPDSSYDKNNYSTSLLKNCLSNYIFNIYSKMVNELKENSNIKDSQKNIQLCLTNKQCNHICDLFKQIYIQFKNPHEMCEVVKNIINLYVSIKCEIVNNETSYSYKFDAKGFINHMKTYKI